MKVLPIGTNSTCRWCGRDIVLASFGYSESWVNSEHNRLDGEDEYKYQIRISECEEREDISSRIGVHEPENYCWWRTGAGRCIVTPRPNEPVVACGRHMKAVTEWLASRAEYHEDLKLRGYEDTLPSERMAFLRNYGLLSARVVGYQGDNVQLRFAELANVLERMQMTILRLQGEVTDDHPFGTTG